jgi:hypothetical protein
VAWPDALKAGRRAAPFPIVPTKRESWYFEYRSVLEQDPDLLAFRDWLHGEAERQRRIEPDLLNKSLKSASRKRAPGYHERNPVCP